MVILNSDHSVAKKHGKVLEARFGDNLHFFSILTVMIGNIDDKNADIPVKKVEDNAIEKEMFLSR